MLERSGVPIEPWGPAFETNYVHAHTNYTWLQNCMKLVSYGFSIHQSYSHTEIIKISFKELFFFFLKNWRHFSKCITASLFLGEVDVYSVWAALSTPPPPCNSSLRRAGRCLGGRVTPVVWHTVCWPPSGQMEHLLPPAPADLLSQNRSLDVKLLARSATWFQAWAEDVPPTGRPFEVPTRELLSHH